MQMTGWLIVNAFYVNQRLLEQYDLLEWAFAMRGVHLERHTNASLRFGIGEYPRDLPDFVIAWDKDVLLIRQLEQFCVRVFNGARATAVADDKAHMYLAFADARLPIPRTYFAPMTYSNIGYPEEALAFVDKIAERIGYPIVIKEACSSYGMGVHLACDRDQAIGLLPKLYGNIVFQQFIAESAGTDVRIYVVGDRCVCSALRRNTRDFRSNIVAGGTMTAYNASEQMQQIAVAAARSIGADFAGVDLLLGRKGPLVCEVNTCAHFGTLYHVLGVNVADEIVDYVMKNVYEL